MYDKAKRNISLSSDRHRTLTFGGLSHSTADRLSATKIWSFYTRDSLSLPPLPSAVHHSTTAAASWSSLSHRRPWRSSSLIWGKTGYLQSQHIWIEEYRGIVN